ncbi:MAG: hypothetical protein V9G19_01615 [Tetrasphaera sp.]
MTRDVTTRATALLVAAMLAMVGLLGGCRDDKPSATPGAAAGLTLSGVPSGKYRVANVGEAAPGQPWMRSLAPSFAVEPSGALAQPATVTVALSKSPATDEVVLIGTREKEADPWTYVPARLAADGKTASVEVEHFSFFTAVLVALRELADVFVDQFGEALTGGLGQSIKKPTCADSKAALAGGYAVSASSKSDAVYWCLGLESGKRVLKLVNHRRYPMLVSHPKLAVLRQKPASASLAKLPTLSRAVSGSGSVVASGDEIVYAAELPAGTRTSVATQADGFGQSLAALETGVTTLVEILTLVKPGKKDAVDVMKDVLRVKDCAAPLGSLKDAKAGDYLVDCLQEGGLEAIVGRTWAPVFAKLLAFGKVVAFLQGEVNVLVDSTLSHDRLAVSIGRASTAMTRDDLLTAPVPALRGNPAGNLVDGKLPNPTGSGSVTLERSGGAAAAIGDVTGDDAADAAAVISFTAGAGGLDQTVYLYSKATGKVVRLGEYDLVAVDPGAHASVRGMTIASGQIQLSWSTWAAATGTRRWQAELDWDGTVLVARSQREVSVGAEAAAVGNAFLDALTNGDRATAARLASPAALAEFDRFLAGNPGDRWFKGGSPCTASGEPPECEILLGLGRDQAEGYALIFRLVFGVDSAGNVRVDEAIPGGDAG